MASSSGWINDWCRGLMKSQCAVQNNHQHGTTVGIKTLTGKMGAREWMKVSLIRTWLPNTCVIFQNPVLKVDVITSTYLMTCALLRQHSDEWSDKSHLPCLIFGWYSSTCMGLWVHPKNLPLILYWLDLFLRISLLIHMGGPQWRQTILYFFFHVRLEEIPGASGLQLQTSAN